MKRIFLYLLALVPFCASAQTIASGYYRVQHTVTERFMTIVDTAAVVRASATAGSNVESDLKAIHMMKNFKDSISFNAASICYIEYVGGNSYNLSGQGLDLYTQTGRTINAINHKGNWWLYATASGVSRYLIDNTYHGTVFWPTISTEGSSNRDWKVLPVDQNNDNQYFGIKPDLNVGGAYWATMYAGFPYKSSDGNTKIYRVMEVIDKYAIIEEVDEVPAGTPVLIHCGTATPSGNRMTLLTKVTASIGANSLRGNWYCNDVVNSPSDMVKHRHLTPYNASTMRMLGVSDGKPAFVKGDDQNLVRSKVDGKLYLPANRCYLSVSSTAPDVLEIVTKEEYLTGIHEIVTPVTEGKKVIYDLQGRRVQAPSKGLYIVNGKKVVIK